MHQTRQPSVSLFNHDSRVIQQRCA